MHKTTKTTRSLMGLLVVGPTLVMAIGASPAFATAASEFLKEGKVSPAGLTFTGAGALATFKGAKGSIVTCEKSASSGKIISATEAEVVVTYSGSCELKKAAVEGSCSNTRNPGEIKTEKLTVQPGVISGSGRGLLFTASGDKLAEFTCGSAKAKITVTGGLICENPEPKVLSEKGLIVCTQVSGKEGVQSFKSIDLEVGKLIDAHLTAKATIFEIFEETEEDAQITNEMVLYSEKIEQT